MEQQKMKGIIIVGDSVVAGRGVSNRSLSFASIVKRKVEIPVLIKGKSFLTTTDILSVLEKYIITKPDIYSHVILLTGNNDGRLIGVNKPILDVNQFKANLEKMIFLLRQNQKEAIICNLQPLSNQQILKIHPQMVKALTLKEFTPCSWHGQYSDACEETAKKMDVFFIDIREALQRANKEVIADYCLDPNADGHLIIAKTILNKLKEKYNIIINDYV